MIFRETAWKLPTGSVSASYGLACASYARLVPTFGDPGAYKALVRAENRAVCAALAEE